MLFAAPVNGLRIRWPVLIELSIAQSFVIKKDLVGACISQLEKWNSLQMDKTKVYRLIPTKSEKYQLK